jgi:TrmH family RNA methyltransferase
MPTQAEIKRLRSLSRRKERREQRQFLAEGVRLLEEAERHRFLPHRVYFAESEMSDRARSLVGAFRLYKVDCQATPARQLRQISDVKTTQGIVASFSIPEGLNDIDSLRAELRRRQTRKILLCEGVGDPGNLGTLLRSALAFGFGIVALAAGCVDPYSPKVVRSSAGAIFGLEIYELSVSDVLKLASEIGLSVIAADASGEHRIKDVTTKARDKGVAVAVGAEATGLSPAVRSAASWRLRIPHLPTVESLNAGVAGSILMSQLYDE